MYYFKPPDLSHVEAVLALNQASPFSYGDIGITQSVIKKPSKRYKKDLYQVILGSGPSCFEQAKSALEHWGMFALDWIRLYPAKPNIKEGELVGVLIKVFGVWVLNLCRVVKVIQEERRFGFSYGTLRQHAESGEEIFLVNWSEQTNEVSFEITAFSRPNYLLAKLGYPFVRALQKRFGKEALKKMRALTAGIE